MRILLKVLLCVVLLHSPFAHGAQGKEFFTSVIYGTLAGTLVGSATLAFTSNPGENLNAVARGASYGLYAGILLGLYVTYGVSDGPDEMEMEQGPIETEPEAQPNAPPEGGPSLPNNEEGSIRQLYKGFAIYPIIPQTPKESWGVGVNLISLHF